MKKYTIQSIAALVCLLSACTKIGESGNGPENAVYMQNPNAAGVVSMIVSNEKGGSAIVLPRLANITDEPVNITVALDKKILEDYNTKNKMDFAPISAEDFVFVTKDGKETTGEVTVTVEKGNYQESVEVKMKSVDGKKYEYSKRFAIPVVIKAASKYRMLSSPNFTIITLNRTLKTSVGLMSSGGFSIVPKTDITEQLNAWSFQMSVIYSSLTRGNLTTAYVSKNVTGGGEFYTRINAESGIQVKNGRDGDDTWTQMPLKPGVWLHITYVYKDQSLSVYVNGVLQKTFKTSPIYPGAWVVGNGGYKNDYIREVRFWKKALTEAEIADKLYLPQDPKTPDLLMYIPITEEHELNELTGNWTVTKGDATNISYVKNVIFPAEKLQIEE